MTAQTRWFLVVTAALTITACGTPTDSEAATGSGSSRAEAGASPGRVATSTTHAGEDPTAAVELVTNAYYALRPTTAAQVGLNVLNNQKLQDELRACIEGKGLTFQDYELTFDTDAAVATSRNPNGVDTAWYIPPDVDGARNGLGLAGPVDLDYGARPTGDSSDPPTELDAEYTAVFNECARATPDPTSFDPTLMEDLHGQMWQIGQETMKLPAFAELQRQYEACVRDQGFDFTDPATLLDLAKATYGKVEQAKAVEFERAIAVADAVCREPLYNPFIELNASTWLNWLGTHRADIDAVAADFARLAAAATG